MKNLRRFEENARRHRGEERKDVIRPCPGFSEALEKFWEDPAANQRTSSRGRITGERKNYGGEGKKRQAAPRVTAPPGFLDLTSFHLAADPSELYHVGGPKSKRRLGGKCETLGNRGWFPAGPKF
ncbi:hypothetical protein KM043_010826 [Ampulex compressa]|nr:hypothetical protein KM043_010826 [Ampulex compressa]